MTARPAIIPVLRYRDAPAAIDFLCTAFGFERHAVHNDDQDPSIVQHAQLVLDGNMVMVSSELETPFSRVLTSPREAKGNTQSIYVVVDDVEAHARRAREAGAEIFLGPEEQSYGGSNYGALDPEGHAWSFGDYDPWAD